MHGMITVVRGTARMYSVVNEVISNGHQRYIIHCHYFNKDIKFLSIKIWKIKLFKRPLFFKDETNK